MPAESQLIESIRKTVRKAGGKVIKIHQSGFSEIGVPDLAVIMPGHGTVWVEAKAPGKRPTKVQLLKMKEINDAGGRAFWTSDIDGFWRLLTGKGEP